MEIIEEWAGCSLELGWTGSKSKGLASWAAAWGLGSPGGCAFMEIWRENSQTLFSGRQILGEPSAADPMGSDAIKAIYHKAVDQKRTQGYIAVKFNDSKRGGIPSFSSGEGERIAAAGIIDGGGLDVQSLSRESLEGAMKSFTERLERGWSGASNAKVLLAELRQIQQRVEAYCEASGQEADCSELRERLAATKAAVQAVLTA